MAAFLILVGLTGSLLAFYPELERLVHPHWYVDRAPGSWLDAGPLVERLEAEASRLKVQSITWQDYAGATSASVSGANDPASGKPFELGYSHVILDPATGQVLDRLTGSFEDGWGHLMGFVYSLHYALALDMIGVWALGIIALAWTLDCFVGFYLTLPVRRRNSPSPPAPLALAGEGSKSWWQRWKPAWTIRWRAGSYKLNFDLHRASSLWLWPVLLVFAWSSVAMNLWDTVYTWATRTVVEYRPDWTELQPLDAPLASPTLSWREAQATGERLLTEQARHWGFAVQHPVGLSFDPDRGLYEYRVRTDREIEDRSRHWGTTRVFFDADTGALKLFMLPSGQYAGNTLTNWLYALHMANVFGLPYRIFVCLLGLAIALLSVTGVIIWWRKRRAARHQLS